LNADFIKYAIKIEDNKHFRINYLIYDYTNHKMAHINRSRKIIPIDNLEEYKNKVVKDGRTIIELSDNHILSIKNYNSRGHNKLINDSKQRTKLISTRERLLEKLIDKKVKEDLQILNDDLKELRD